MELFYKVQGKRSCKDEKYGDEKSNSDQEWHQTADRSR